MNFVRMKLLKDTEGNMGRLVPSFLLGGPLKGESQRSLHETPWGFEEASPMFNSLLRSFIGGALRDIPKNDCVKDYMINGSPKKQLGTSHCIELQCRSNSQSCNL